LSGLLFAIDLVRNVGEVARSGHIVNRKVASNGYFCRMNELKDRIREAASETGGLKRLSELLPVPRRTLGNWLEGVQPKPEALERIAEVTGVSLGWLVSGEGDKFETAVSRAIRQLEGAQIETRWDAEEAEGAFGKGVAVLTSRGAAAAIEDRFVVIPKFDVRASAGAGQLVRSDDVAEYISVGRTWLRRHLPAWAPPNAVVGMLDSHGDSMEPTIRDGDSIMVVHGVTWSIVDKGGIFLFTYDDRLLTKRLQILNNGDLKVISDNSAYEPWTIDYDQLQYRVRILGYVFYRGGRPGRF
jgi:phage repressor protein C with HTH and peptisase S24 domain